MNPAQSDTTLFYESVEREKPVGKLFVKWCWPAFFFGCFWLIYRRRLKLALLLVMLQLIIDIFLVEPLLKTYNGQSNKILWDLISGLALSIFLGMFGVSLYMKAWVKNPKPHDRFNKYLKILIKLLLMIVYCMILFSAFVFFRRLYITHAT